MQNEHTRPSKVSGRCPDTEREARQLKISDTGIDTPAIARAPGHKHTKPGQEFITAVLAPVPAKRRPPTMPPETIALAPIRAKHRPRFRRASQDERPAFRLTDRDRELLKCIY